MSIYIPQAALVLAGILYCLGFFGLIFRRNILFMLLAVEIMINASALAFIAAAAFLKNADGQVMVLFILAMAAAELSVGLALVLLIRRQRDTLDTNDMNLMRG